MGAKAFFARKQLSLNAKRLLKTLDFFHRFATLNLYSLQYLPQCGAFILSDGVMVAQVTLTHFVQVRILVGQPLKEAPGTAISL